MATPVLPTRLVAYTGAANTVDAFAQNAVVTVSHGTASTLTLPESTSIMFPLGTVIQVIQIGVGTVTVVKTGSDTIVGTVATALAGDTLFVTKTSATGWHSGLAT
jgi:hypothetical protein